MSHAEFARGRDGTRIFVRRRDPERGAASAPTAILCDGIACDGFIWRYLWHDLARILPVAHWHYRGHGRSAKPADPRAITFEEHVHDLDAVRRTIGDPDVVLFGHSMGCQVALETMRLRPDKVRGLVLLCGASGRITHTFKGTNTLAQVLPTVIARVEAHPAIARAVWSRVPPEVALRVALMTGEVDAAAIDPADLLPYMKHMVDIDLPM
ncbi:MAG TPA: alpha/beta hydrolase, partial [Byssovorax sp.]